MTIDACAFTDNAAGSGGAIHARLQDALVVRDSTFTGNTGAGGAIGFGASTSVVIQGATFEANVSLHGTAAFYGGATAVAIEDTTWSGNGRSNRATALYVGGEHHALDPQEPLRRQHRRRADWLSGAASANYELVDSDFDGNTNPTNVAGPLAIVPSPLLIRGCTFTDNAGFYQGDAALVGQDGGEHVTQIEASTFEGNSSPLNGHDVPRTLVCIACLVSAHTWVVVALALACGPRASWLTALVGTAARQWRDA